MAATPAFSAMERFVACPGIEMTRFGSECYLVKARRPIAGTGEGYLVSINEVSAFYWKQLERPRSRDELIEALSEEYDVSDASAAARDLDRLLAEWTKAGCIETVTGD